MGKCCKGCCRRCCNNSVDAPTAQGSWPFNRAEPQQPLKSENTSTTGCIAFYGPKEALVESLIIEAFENSYLRPSTESVD